MKRHDNPNTALEASYRVAMRTIARQKSMIKCLLLLDLLMLSGIISYIGVTLPKAYARIKNFKATPDKKCQKCDGTGLVSPHPGFDSICFWCDGKSEV